MNKKDYQIMARKISAQYIENPSSELDVLRKLDLKVKRPANIFAYIFGSIGAIIMGSGMSLVMTEIGSSIGLESSLGAGIIIGIIGMIMALLNYPIYKKILNSRKKKYSEQIIELSNKIIND